MFYFAKQEQYCSSQNIGSIARNSFKLCDIYTHHSIKNILPAKFPVPSHWGREFTPPPNIIWKTLDYDSRSPALLDLFNYSVASICSTMAFLPLGSSDDAVVSVSFEFLSNSKQDALFHHIAYDHSCADWGGLCDHLRGDVP